VVCSSQQQQAPQYKTKEELQVALKQAIAAEDYATAARLKEQIVEIEMQDPLTGLKWALDAAIAEERYAVSLDVAQHHTKQATSTLLQQRQWPCSKFTVGSWHGSHACCTWRMHRMLHGCVTK